MTKTIIITGATSGIGNTMTHYLAKMGHNVIAVGRNEKVLQELDALYPTNVKTIIADITTSEDRKKIPQSLPVMQGIYLINNAGIAIPRLLENLKESEWEQHYLVNTKAPLFLTQLLLPHLKNGRILNISSGLAHNSLSGMIAYGVTKAALFMMKEYFNSELKDHKILTGSAMPGIVDTPIQEHIRNYSNTEFPSVDLFKGFQERDELLMPMTVAKFLTYVLMETNDDCFMKGEWDIYDNSHHKYWAESNEIKRRKK